MNLNEVIILAGGKGTRIQAVLNDLPKCLAPINGHPFLFYLINYLNNNGIKKYIFSLGYNSKKIIDYVENFHCELDYEFVIESFPLFTGGAIREAIDSCVSENILIINADTLFEIDIQLLFKYHIKNRSDCTIALKMMTNFERYGVVNISDKNRILSFKEKKYYEQGLINGGIYILNITNFKKHIFDESFSFEKEYLEKYVNTDQFYGFVYDHYFIDIGVPEDYYKAQLEINL
jgi:D-glycero-alpha-D-manno-heptose 1-phosphate guanylyltransferase